MPVRSGNHTWEVGARHFVWLHTVPLKGRDAGTPLPAPVPRSWAAGPAQLWFGYGCSPFPLASPETCQPLPLPAGQPVLDVALSSVSPMTTDHTMSAFLQHYILSCSCKLLLSAFFSHLCYLFLQPLQFSLVVLFQWFANNSQPRLLLTVLCRAFTLQLLHFLTDKNKIIQI